MTNKEKAIEFMKRHEENDPRCQMLVMFMSAMLLMSPEQILANIKKLAEEE